MYKVLEITISEIANDEEEKNYTQLIAVYMSYHGFLVRILP